MEPEVLLRGEGSILHITLNRPRAINALSINMVTELRDVFRSIDDQGFSAVVIDGSGERGFCGGGDVKQLSACNDQDAQHFLHTEYEADWLISGVKTPVISLMTGITMGGGIGVGGYASHRVVTESTVMAMPETRIGLAPDVGANFLLAKTPGAIGEYLAVTGARFTAGDALELGFADYCVQSSHLTSLVAAIADGADPTLTLAESGAPAPAGELLSNRDWIDECFTENSIIDVVAALESHRSDAARAAAREIRTLSPISVAVAFWALRLARQDASLRAVFDRDERVMLSLLENFDAHEGIRALLVDKDMQPRWSPARIEDVTVAQLEMVFGAEVHSLLTENRV